ncbi:MAG: AAA family ATPase [Clostridia bacterium]|nr:AAA family ATPase [Clostridia bacterium]
MLTGYKDFRAGLLGRKLGHSYSKIIHKDLADYTYEMFEREEDEVGDFIKNGPFDAINVTVPYKKTVIPFLDELSDTAQKLGAVNTIVRRRDGTLYGDNTDVYGFSYMLDIARIDVKDKKSIVLGAGGASATVCEVLKRRGASEITVVGRADNNPENLARHSDAEIIVNATPVGMYPENEGLPVDIRLFPKCVGLADLIYNPARTNIICDAEDIGINRINGLTMLVAQAKRACEIFLGREIEDSVIPEITKKIEKSQENIVLIGMPGCGKSTLARKVSEKLGRALVDTDEEIVKLAGKSIPEIFAQDGEDAFRDLESQVAERVGKMAGAVIATGGGIIKREKNYRPLHRNGRIVFLHRDINELDTSGRPLSQRDGVEKLYRERLPLYRRYADCEIAVEKDPNETYNNLADVLGLK